jgi:PIN domain nuclease of toxin-antitoxin system
VRLLLDTHALLWWLFDDPRLSPVARAAIATPDNDVLVSAASAWEIATKHRLGKLPDAGDVPTALARYVRRSGFQVLPIGFEHAALAGAIVADHKDPFDRMIAAQGRVEDIPVVTIDAAIVALGAKTIW